ncbi:MULTISPECIES: hypothetical protein [unclassified Variovorax]|uniref:hypothetical protein n=1 Tax=unclassified Variovorax TaxID=663243 RepID=UPI0008C7837B|nr:MULTISPECIES: hypothetical protein [unclassified Variovorax]SEK17404.1 hypothetical protein SAMN05518853_1516 [Variovorax sp. OK202]SFE83092.1 hypothetical protein SAMN05444746_1496 [Variovorax sp. OK212]
MTKHWAPIRCKNARRDYSDNQHRALPRLPQAPSRKGGHHICVAVDGDTARRLRAIAREHKQSMGEVLKMAPLLTLRALANLPRNTAE